MQRHSIKFICIIFGLLMQVIDSQAEVYLSQKADSLFNEKKYEEAAIMFEQLLEIHSVNRENTFLKLAFISEQKGDFSRAIFFLSEYYELNPSDATFDKINKMAAENSFGGYSWSDLNFILLLYQEYFIWICLCLMGIVCYSFLTILKKVNKKELVALRHKVTLVFFLLGLLGFVNIGRLYKQGIVKKGQIYIRSDASAGSNVASLLDKGSRVNIIGEKDVWLRLLLNGKVQFAKKSDFWIIGENR
ncbi:MAG: tetratricopeptide (TPR) repeat protein [Arcticibacterium sp.]|jgi:tetratricopeptide (TPR) repeat protein